MRYWILNINKNKTTDDFILYQVIYPIQKSKILSDVPTFTSVTFNLLEPQTECKQEMENNNYYWNIFNDSDE